MGQAVAFILHKSLTGEQVALASLSALKRMILLRETTRDDAISKTGQRFTALGDVPELESLFQAADAAASASANNMLFRASEVFDDSVTTYPKRASYWPF